MIVDLVHNKIIAATMTEAFAKSFKEELLPRICEKYGDSVTLVQMYEDHIADGFTIGAEFYYPLTVVTDKLNTQWVKWKLAKGKFEANSPYAYLGDKLDFELVDTAPAEFCQKLIGRARFCESGLVKLRVETTLKDVTVLSGKYSQTFIDEMARQLTAAIEQTASVEGIAESGLELCLVFAPETYMEHTSENVTYRRLLLTDNSGAPRDFWIKWTRLDGAIAYTVNSCPDASSVLFEIGEDVNQKVREKEYRFLLSAKGKDKYHNAMGRKNITEWREIIKRAIRRGELVKIEQEQTISKETEALTRELLSVVGGNIPTAEETEVVASRESDEELARALAFARSALEESSDGEPFVEEDGEDLDEEDELDEFYKEEADEPALIKFDPEEENELDELSRLAKAELQNVKATEVSFDDEQTESEEILELTEDEPEEIALGDETEEAVLGDETEEIAIDDETEEVALDDESEEIALGDEIEEEPVDPTADEYTEIEDEDSLEEDENEEALRELEELEGSAEQEPSPTPAVIAETVAPPVNAAPVFTVAELEQKIRAELEAKLRLEYEQDARRKAEQEAQRLRRENEKLLLAVKEEEERKAQREKERLAETEKLKIQIEAQLRAEERERERLADAARAAVEEQRRLEEEKVRLDRLRLEEEKRLEAEARAKALEEERAREADRIRRETEERIRAEYEQKKKETEYEPIETEEELYAPAEEKPAPKESYVNPGYTYVSKSVKLLFRRSVDPNITGRIHEIIKATLDYYGKSKVYLKIKATVPDTSTVILEFVKIPMEEMELLGNIIKVLGNSGLGIAKAIVE